MQLPLPLWSMENAEGAIPLRHGRRYELKSLSCPRVYVSRAYSAFNYGDPDCFDVIYRRTDLKQNDRTVILAARTTTLKSDSLSRFLSLSPLPLALFSLSLALCFPTELRTGHVSVRAGRTSGGS